MLFRGLLERVFKMWNDDRGATDLVTILLLIFIAILFAVLFLGPIKSFLGGLF